MLSNLYHSIVEQIMPLELDVDGFLITRRRVTYKLNLEALTSVTLDNETIPIIARRLNASRIPRTSIPRLIRTGLER